MNRLIAFVVLSLLCGTVAAEEPMPVLKEHVSMEGKYRAVFPGAVTSTVKEQKTAAGKISIHLDSCEVTPKLSYLVSYNDYPIGVLKVDPQTVLTGVKNGNTGDNGTLVVDKRIMFGPLNAPGRDILIKKPNFYFRNRMVLIGARLYQVIIVGSKDAVESPEANAFIESFLTTP